MRLSLQDIFWAVYVGKSSPGHHGPLAALLLLLTRFLPACRRGPVRGEALQERRHVLGQRGRLRLRLQVGFHGGPL